MMQQNGSICHENQEVCQNTYKMVDMEKKSFIYDYTDVKEITDILIDNTLKRAQSGNDIIKEAKDGSG